MKKAVKNVEEATAMLKERKDEVVQKYRVSELGIFGSFIRGEQRKRSDIDILVEFDEEHIPSLLRLIEMERYLQRLLRKKVDVVMKSGIRAELKEDILKEVIYV